MDIREELMHALFRFRRMDTFFPKGVKNPLEEFDINIMEMALMKGVLRNDPDAEENVTIADLQQSLLITKGAVSQMYGSLESKGYLIREVDPSNRRKLIVTLTPRGREVLKIMNYRMKLLMEETVSRFGEEDMITFVNLLNRYADITKEIKEEICENTRKGDN